MHNITLIVTVHSESGKCNSNELYKIIESINPEIIFEELPVNLFDRIYNGNQISDEPLETKCIKEYLRNRNIKNIPVDIDVSPNLSKSEIEYLFGTFNKYEVYKKLDNEINLLSAQYGFAYLNSDKCSELFDKKKVTEKNIMEFEFTKETLFRIYTLFHEEHDNRENEMLNNIYNFSKENQYNQAVFLIGSAHRNSIMHKITEYDTKNKLKLNWRFYNNPIQ